MRKRRLIRSTVMIVIFSLLVLNKAIANQEGKEQYLRKDIYNFLQKEQNQKQAFSAAIALNNGSSENACVYFVAEVLRKNNYPIPRDTCNTSQIISLLEKRGWKRYNNYKNLKPGDICFTTDHTGSKKGLPTHTYIFMGWVEEGSYEYAYICDNQAKDYENNVYHIRNIKERVQINGLTKDAFSFFMRP
jgi:hypothetical protein